MNCSIELIPLSSRHDSVLGADYVLEVTPMSSPPSAILSIGCLLRYISPLDRSYDPEG